MKSSKNKITLTDIAKLITLLDHKFDEKFKYTNSKIVGIYGELDGVKQQLSSLDGIGTKVDSLDSKLEEFREETQQNFNTVFNGLTNLGETIDKNLEPRIKHLENKVFPQSFPLAK